MGIAKESIVFDVEQIEARYRELRGMRDSGELSDPAFGEAIDALSVQDEEGQWWAIGADSGSWYVARGGTWVEAEPPRAAPPPVAKPPSTWGSASASEPAAKVCVTCGATMEAGARFCELCGAPVEGPLQERAETVIGHLPAERLEEGKGFLGRLKTTKLGLVITTDRVLCLRQTIEMNENWLQEQDRLFNHLESLDVTSRDVWDDYGWSGPPWSTYYETPPDELLSSNRSNEAIPLREVVSATVTLDEELDKLDLVLVNGETYHFQLFILTGEPAARFLGQAVGLDRVRLVKSTER